MTRFGVKLSRVVQAPRSRVYRAFLEPDLVARWLADQQPFVGGCFDRLFATLDDGGRERCKNPAGAHSTGLVRSDGQLGDDPFLLTLLHCTSFNG